MTVHEVNCRIAAFPYAYFSEKPASFSGFDLQCTQTGIIKIIYLAPVTNCLLVYSCSNDGAGNYFAIYC